LVESVGCVVFMVGVSCADWYMSCGYGGLVGYVRLFGILLCWVVRLMEVVGVCLAFVGVVGLGNCCGWGVRCLVCLGFAFL